MALMAKKLFAERLVADKGVDEGDVKFVNGIGPDVNGNVDLGNNLATKVQLNGTAIGPTAGTGGIINIGDVCTGVMANGYTNTTDDIGVVHLGAMTSSITVNGISCSPATTSGITDIGTLAAPVKSVNLTWDQIGQIGSQGDYSAGPNGITTTITGTPVRTTAYAIKPNRISYAIENYNFSNGEVKGLVFSNAILAHAQVRNFRTEYLQITYPFACGLFQVIGPYILSNTSGATSAFILSQPDAKMHIDNITFQDTTFTRTLFDFGWGGYVLVQNNINFTAQPNVKYVKFTLPGTLVVKGTWPGFNASNISGNGTVIVNNVQYSPTIATV